MKKYAAALVWGIMLFGEVLSAHGEERDVKTSVMDEVVVTAGRLAEPIGTQTASILVINAREIAASPARNLGDLLAQKGVGHIKKYPGGLTSIGIRGFKTDTHGNDLRGHVLVLLDGRRAGTGNVAKISTGNIQRVEIIKGPAAVQYGSAAMGGVVNVITVQGQGDLTAKVSGSLASYGAGEAAFAVSGRQAALDYAAGFSRSTMGDYQNGAGQVFHNSGYDRQDSYSANLGFSFLNDQRIGLILTGYQGVHLGSPGYLNNNDLDNYKDARLYSGDLIYSGGNQDKMSWFLRYFQGRDRDAWHDPVASNVSGWDDGVTSMQKTDHQGSQAQVSVELPWVTVTTGLDWVAYEMETTWTPEKTEYENVAAFLLSKGLFLKDRLIVDAALRYDDYEVSMHEPVGNREKDTRLTPSAGLAYLLTEEWKVRVHYGQAFVMPGADQLAADYTTWGTHYLGNPDLEPESSQTWEVGVHYNRPALTAGLSYFQTSFRDKIETVATVGSSSWDNVGRAKLSGVEGDFSYDIGSLFDWPYEVKLFADFVYHDTCRDLENHLDLKYINKWHASYGLSATDYDGFSARLNFAYSGPQIIDDWQSGVFPPSEVEMGGFTVAHVTVVKRVVEFGNAGSLSLRGEIVNLLDKEYAYVKGYPMPGRVFTLGLDWEY